MNATVKPVVIQFKDVVIALQDDTEADVSSHVRMVSTDGIALNPAPVRMGLIAMEQMGGVCVQLDSRETNVSRNAPRAFLAQHVVNLAIVESSNVIRRMESVFVRLEDMEPSVKRNVEQEDMENLV